MPTLLMRRPNEKIDFLFKGSSDEAYKVTFALEGTNLNAYPKSYL